MPGDVPLVPATPEVEAAELKHEQRSEILSYTNTHTHVIFLSLEWLVLFALSIFKFF